VLYDFAGSLNSAFIVISLAGIWAQLRKIWARKHAAATDGRPTAILSLNQFTVSFLAYWSFFVYGYSIQPFNHYIVWPRLVASVMVLLILREIFLDRRSLAAAVAMAIGLLLLVAGLAGLWFGKTWIDEGRVIAQVLIVTITLLLAQGYVHQIRLIRRSGRTGAVSLAMNQFILAMDVTTIFFALVMGLQTGWPLLLLATVSGATKLIIMWLFRWVRVSPMAQRMREQQAAEK
jgi:hypothetical protein